MKLNDSFKKLTGQGDPNAAAKRATSRRNISTKAEMLAAKLLINQMKTAGLAEDLREREFQVFSQFGDDGIIQYLLQQVHIEPELWSFIEFGVESYEESNTRFLLLNNNWRGLVMDESENHIHSIQQDEIFWKHDLTAARAFIDRDNINNLFSQHGFEGEIGLLSIDIDGNDYWVWEKIEGISPVITIVEYNSVFGSKNAITIPYDATFQRSKAHFSNLYYGCSLKALCLLAEKKGYSFVGCNSNGNNTYFIRKDRLGKLRALRPEEGYVESRFRESRDREGRLSFRSGQDRLKEIAGMMVFDLEQQCLVPL